MTTLVFALVLWWVWRKLFRRRPPVGGGTSGLGAH
jgi:hypothetical protein